MTERIKVGAYTLELLDNGTYRASVVPDDLWITVPEEYNGIPVTVIEVIGYDNGSKRMIYVPKTVKIFMNSTAIAPGYPSYVVLVSPENPWLCSDDKAVFSKDKKILYAFTARSDESYIIPDGVKIIYENAFFCTDALKSPVFPEGLEEIGKKAFWNSGLEDIKLPKSVKKLGDNAFAFLNDVNNLILPDNIEEIEGDVFWRSSCSSPVYLPDCYNKPEYGISSYYLAPEYIIHENSKAFVIIDGVIYTKDMKALLAITKKAPSVITVPEGVEVIGMNASVNNTDICEIILPKSVHTIMTYAFSDCSLKKINLEHVKIIERRAFYACEYLTETGRIGAEKIGDVCFNSCKSLGKVHFTNVKEIGSIAFCGLKEEAEIILANEPIMGENSFGEGCVVKVISPDNNEIQYAVKIFDAGDQLKTHEVENIVHGLLGGHLLYYFKKYDEFFESIDDDKCFLSKYGAAHYRIKYPKALTDHARKMYTKYLKKFAPGVIRHFIEKPYASVEEIMNFPYLGYVREKALLELIDFSAEMCQPEVSAFLMAYMREHFPNDSKEDRWKI